MLSGVGFAVDNTLESQYGPEYFYAIEGEVHGQAAPGVQAVYVNGKQARLDREQNFIVTISLKEGEKYITIDTRYEGLQFVKKYLVVRHPKAQKSFKLTVPKQEFQKIIESTPVIKEEKAAYQKSVKVRPVQKKKTKGLKKTPAVKPVVTTKAAEPDWLGFELVKELKPNKYYVVRNINNKYYGLIYLYETKQWFNLSDLNLKQFEELIFIDPAASSEAENTI